jgi:hypothetical protein
MPHPALLVVFRVYLPIAAFLAISGAQAQNIETTASCSNFKVFQLNPSDPTNPPINVFGVNDWGTTVGQVFTQQQPLRSEAFVRYSGGSVKYYSPTGAIHAQFSGRNNNGTSVGDYEDALQNFQGFMLQGSTITPIIDPKSISPNGTTTRPFSINKWNSVVGRYIDPSSSFWQGFKRYSNGSFITLNYPRALGTYPNGINDSGVIVGVYNDVNYSSHGFIYHNGQWATLDFINSSTGTGLIGITNSGVILGEGSGSCNSMGCGLSGAFLYVNGTFKDLPEVPNSKNPPGSTVSSTRYSAISAGGLLAGTTNMTGDSTGSRGFTVTCH